MLISMTRLHTPTNASAPWSWPAFAGIMVLQLWLTHAIAFFLHEYAHATTAWLMSWKGNPLALHYGHLNISNLLTMSDIDENVNYAPIFASGHDRQAGIIAAAGAAIGNGLVSYPISRWGYTTARRDGSRLWAMFSYWLCVMSLGNFIDYVPVRTFSNREDMHTTAVGFHCSPWWILLVLGVPFSVAIIHFFLNLQPRALRWLAPGSPARQGILSFFTAAALFSFFGLAGLSNSGVAAHRMSIVSVTVLFPLAAIGGFWMARRGGDTD